MDNDLTITDSVKKDNISQLIESEDPYSSIISLEDRLKVIANLIVDRIIEDQQNGTPQKKLIK